MRSGKRSRSITILSVVSIFLICGCKKTELPVAPHDPGEVNTTTLELTENYKYQLFYDLGNDEVVAKNLKTAWDIGFECRSGGWHVILNNSRGMKAAITDEQDLASVNDTTGVEWFWDDASGDRSATAFGNWKNDSSVRIIDMGYPPSGQHLGFRKMKMLNLEQGQYRFRFSYLDGSGERTATVVKDPDRVFVRYSMLDQQEVNLAPPKDEWDLLFTQYLHTFPDPPTSYLVSGVLLNPHRVRAGRDTTINFSLVELQDSVEFALTQQKDVIGYDWKRYDLNAGTYEVFPNKIFFIQDTEGFYYKLRFTDYYNEQGQKGYPRFEFQKL